ncbi:MAG: glycosyltransferase family 4 protein [Lachnospiraceae bacterium]|nr:glycosyltransferase family 4 protein [Lachnospiraceae bacterium]
MMNDQNRISETNKWVLIGPVYPYKGGISHYTGLMYRALSKVHDTVMISYKMQYPRILFKKEQRDYDNDTFRVEDTQFLINTANPFNILATARRIVKLKPEKVIIQWWHPYFAPCYVLLAGRLKKAGIQVIYICHNVFPHERFPLDKQLTRMALKRGNKYILHAQGEVKELLSIRPDADYRVTVHPTYSAFNFENMDIRTARNKLGIPENEQMMLFFGFVREYKGLRHLINAEAILKDRYNKSTQTLIPKLYIVGDFDGNKDEYLELINKKGIADRVTVIDGYVPDKEVEKYFSAADLVVLPYESATQSGIVQIAYGFRKPVIVTNVGGLPEVVDNGVTGDIIEPFDDNALAGAIYRYFAEGRKEAYTQGIIEREHRFSWDRMAELLSEI